MPHTAGTPGMLGWADGVDAALARRLVLAPAPTGIKATDEANVQPLVTAAQATGGAVYLQAGTYVMDLTTSKMATQPKIIGMGRQFTKIDGKLTIVGTSGQFSGGYLSDLSFIGTRTVALEIRGACDVHWDRISFAGSFSVGLLLHNYATGDFTELCSGMADFSYGVACALEYRVTSGDVSFHGSGLTEGSTINQVTTDTGPKILIGTGAMPYNAPLSVTIWARTTQPLMVHSGSPRANFYGHMKVELLNDIAAPYAIILDWAATPLPYTGTVSTMGASVQIGRLVISDQVDSNYSSGSAIPRIGGKIIGQGAWRSVGATATLPADVPFHDLTMSANCTFTFTGPMSSTHMFLLQVAGAFSPTWPSSVKWDQGVVPTYAQTAVYEFITFNGGASWIGKQLGRAVA